MLLGRLMLFSSHHFPNVFPKLCCDSAPKHSHWVRAPGKLALICSQDGRCVLTRPSELGSHVTVLRPSYSQLPKAFLKEREQRKLLKQTWASQSGTCNEQCKFAVSLNTCALQSFDRTFAELHLCTCVMKLFTWTLFYS